MGLAETRRTFGPFGAVYDHYVVGAPPPILQNAPSTVKQQQEECLELLKAIRDYVDPGAIVAGGAPRNWDSGDLANDLDIYLQAPVANTDKEFYAKHADVKRYIRALLPDVAIDDHQPFKSPYRDGVAFVIQTMINITYRGMKGQLIFIGTGKGPFCTRVMNHFDTGINRIWCTVGGDGLMTKRTQQYIDDRDQKTLTLYPDNMSKDQLLHCIYSHLPKMLKYYPSHSFRIKCSALKDRRHEDIFIGTKEDIF